jgi:hypothetical protein
VIIDAATQVLTAIVGGAISTAGDALALALSVLPVPSISVPFYGTLNRGLPLTEICTVLIVAIGIKAAAVAYLAGKEVLGYIPFLGIGKH